MTLREAKIKARIARLEEELAEIKEAEALDTDVEADGSSMIRSCTASKRNRTAGDDFQLPDPPADITSGDLTFPEPPTDEASAPLDMEASIRRNRINASKRLRTAGIENEINQKYLTSMEKITKTPAGVDPSIRTKLRHASRVCDRVADELEKQGRIALAYRVDRVADEIDRKLARLGD